MTAQTGALLWLSSWLLVLLWDRLLFLRFGIRWDRHLNPHCPTCRSPLANRATRTDHVFSSDPGEALLLRDTMQCLRCDKFLRPDLEHLPPGIVRDFANARRLLRGQAPETAEQRKSQRP